MFYIFKNDKCIACSDYEPNHDDLATRGEFAVESDSLLPIEQVTLDSNNKVIQITLTNDIKKQQAIDDLDTQYQSQFKQLQQAWAAAQLDGNTTLATELQVEYQALKAEYQTAREVILND